MRSGRSVLMSMRDRPLPRYQLYAPHGLIRHRIKFERFIVGQGEASTGQLTQVPS